MNYEFQPNDSLQETQNSNQIIGESTRTVEALDDVFDEMDNIEETAAKVLFGLQNMDRTESPQFSVTIGQPTQEMNSEFLNYTNFKTEKKGAVSRQLSGSFFCFLKFKFKL